MKILITDTPMTQRAHESIQAVLNPGDVAVDATVGNGYDTCVLAARVGPSGHVYGFDIQATALETTKQKLKQQHLDTRVSLINDSHAEMHRYIEDQHQPHVKAIMFNLGYLPGGEKTITTEAAATMSALRAAEGLLQVGGIITITAYTGHPGGQREADEVERWAQELANSNNYNVSQECANPERTNPPKLFVIRKQIK